VADEPTVLVDDLAPLTRMEGANLGAGRTAAEAAGVELAVEGEHSHDGAHDERETEPMTPDQCMNWELWRLIKALPERRY